MNPLTDAEKVDIRRFCGYPAYGAASGPLQSWRFFQVYGLLEFRMNNLSISELVIARRYLTTLTSLEVAVPGVSNHLDTDVAATWTRNRDELTDRLKLLDSWRRRLCGFIGVAPGPSLPGVTGAMVV